MSKKVLIILSLIIVIFLIILGFLFFIARSNPKPTDSDFTKTVRNLFPFGQPSRDPDQLFPGEDQSYQPGNNAGFPINSDQPVPRLRQISNTPVSGSIIWVEITPDKEKLYHVRFVDRATGHVSDTLANDFEIQKISNTTLPKIYEAKFATKDSFLARFLSDVDNETIKTYFVTLKDKILPNSTSTATSTEDIYITPKESVGNYLEENIKELALSPSKNKIIYSIYTDSGGALITSNLNGSGKKQIYSSPLREWLLGWQSEANAVITTKPSGFVPGYSYLLNINSGTISKITGNITGLTILPVGINKYLVGDGSGSINLSLLNLGASDNTNLYLSKTLPEKCTASKTDAVIIYCAVPMTVLSGAYPDDWYKSLISFNDAFWRINIETGQTTQLFIPERESGQGIDAINLEVSENDSYLTFINKKDLTLWGYQLQIIPKKEVLEVNASSTPATSAATSTATSTR